MRRAGKRGPILRYDAIVNPERRWEQILKDGRKPSLSMVTQLAGGRDWK